MPMFKCVCVVLLFAIVASAWGGNGTPMARQAKPPVKPTALSLGQLDWLKSPGYHGPQGRGRVVWRPQQA
jgi:hypothetical protein